jgi:RNA polymerase sigma factor (sigma-70 family)
VAAQPLGDLSDVAIAERLRSGDLSNSLVTEVYRRYFRSMLSSAAAVLKKHSYVAEDVAQETLVRLLLGGQLSRVRDPSSLPVFLRTSAKRGALDALRLIERRGEALASRDPEGFLDEAPGPTTTAQLIERLHSELRRLEAEDAAVLRLRLAEQKSLSETADALGISYSAAAQRFSRAMGRLRKRAS